MTRRIVVGALATLMATAALPASAPAESLVLPPPEPTNRVVVIVHGSGGSAKQITDFSLWREVPILLARGFAVAASDAHGPQTWGNPESVRDYEHLIHRLRGRGFSRVFLLGGSMGALATMQLIGRVNPEAVSLVSPICNLRAVNISPLLIEEAWGDARPAYLSPVRAHPEKGLRVKIWASPEDTWVPARQNADVCARELSQSGAVVHTVATSGNHPEALPEVHEIPDFFSSIERGP